VVAIIEKSNISTLFTRLNQTAKRGRYAVGFIPYA
jgi:hypothetical protein